MERQEILNGIIEILKNDLFLVSADAIITEETELNSLDIDEIDCVEIEIELESKFKLPITSCDEFVSKSNIIKDLIDKLSDALNNK